MAYTRLEIAILDSNPSGQRTEHHCCSCGYNWISRCNPKRCSKCLAYHFETPRNLTVIPEQNNRKLYHCKRCGYEWYATKYPGLCASCKQPQWDTDYKNNVTYTKAIKIKARTQERIDKILKGDIKC